MIGFFDSGVGGYNYMKAFNRISTIPTYYHCDPEHLPFGSKSPQVIQQLTIHGVEHLFNQNCKLVVLACNTASVRSIRYIQQSWLPQSLYAHSHQVLGISTPFLEYIQTYVTTSERSIVFGTSSTISSGFYQDYLAQHHYRACEFYALPDLATLIENNSSDQILLQYIIDCCDAYSINPSSYSSVLLGCTHYHAIDHIFQSIFTAATIHNHMHFCAQQLLAYTTKHPEYLS